MPSLAILFWFYKELDICENRLQIIKKYNPEIKIYGLYGGPHKDEAEYKSRLSPYLNDFYTASSEDSSWKWLHGDLVLLEWCRSRGKDLSWDSIVVVQWDLLLFDSVQNLFSKIKSGEIFLSGLRDLSRQVEDNWWWTRPDSPERETYKKFLDHVKTKYAYERRPPLVCQFILEVFPREFFDKYAMVENRELGMLEYKVPTYADIFKIPFFEKDMGVAWRDLGENVETVPLNASPTIRIQESYIRRELAKSDGWRVFHPYQKLFKQM